MFRKVKEKVEKEIDKINAEDIKKGTATLATAAAEAGVETVKSGLNGFINGVLIKIVVVALLLVFIFVGGCSAITSMNSSEDGFPNSGSTLSERVQQ